MYENHWKFSNTEHELCQGANCSSCLFVIGICPANCFLINFEVIIHHGPTRYGMEFNKNKVLDGWNNVKQVGVWNGALLKYAWWS